MDGCWYLSNDAVMGLVCFGFVMVCLIAAYGVVD